MIQCLIADDELPIREWLVYALQKSSLPVEICAICANGDEARAAIEQHHPDLIITDIKMPGQNGIDLLRSIRAMDLPAYVVMLTSHDSFEYARQSLKYNADEYILKMRLI